MIRPYSVYIVDDDPVMVVLLHHCLARGGFRVAASTASDQALQDILDSRPDCVLLDLMMPGLDGLDICRYLRASPPLFNTKIIIMSGKTYESDRRRALAVGADAFITKPVDPVHFADQVRRILEDRIHMMFWGVRGTLPVPGPRCLRFGGNTPCVSLEFARGPLLIFDAGTGIKALSDHLWAARRTRIDAKIFLSHPHWDHIQALPFFRPLYVPGNQVEILGPSQAGKGVEDFLKEQMDGVYFPVTAQEFGARVSYRNLREETLDLDGIRVRTMLLNHPGHCLGYRVEYGGRAICYITDNELYPATSGFQDEGYLRKLEEFVAEADALIMDATYTDEEYPRYQHWGHSAVGEVVALADRAKAKTLYLFHHDPDQDDEAVERKLTQAQTQLKVLGSSTLCVAASEGQLLRI